MAKAKTVFRCQDCGHESAKWLGRCPDCGGWNRHQEETRAVEAKVQTQRNRTFRLGDEAGGHRPVPLTEVEAGKVARASTGLGELDRVLGGGLVPGSLVLVGGDPGIGKSTLLLQALGGLAGGERPALYVSGEESLEQVRLRAERLGLVRADVLLFAETRVDRVAEEVERLRPAAVVIDSVQTLYDPEVTSAPGSVSQVREVAARCMYLAKSHHVPVFLVGHVTKEGELAGPRVLEHLVDTVLYFEETTGQAYRILRAHKNRFGSTHELGVFSMGERGLAEVKSPSELFLAERSERTSGSAVLAAIEGTRPVLVEVQALTSSASYGTPRRTCLGFDGGRAALLLAVLERRAGFHVGGGDVFVNVAGGLVLADPGADLAVAIALASAHSGRLVTPATVVFGELGLSGEVRTVSSGEPRLAEAVKLGFRRAVVPAGSLQRLTPPAGIDVVGVKTLAEAIDAALGFERADDRRTVRARGEA